MCYSDCLGKKLHKQKLLVCHVKTIISNARSPTRLNCWDQLWKPTSATPTNQQRGQRSKIKMRSKEAACADISINVPDEHTELVLDSVPGRQDWPCCESYHRCRDPLCTSQKSTMTTMPDDQPVCCMLKEYASTDNTSPRPHPQSPGLTVSYSTHCMLSQLALIPSRYAPFHVLSSLMAADILP